MRAAISDAEARFDAVRRRVGLVLAPAVLAAGPVLQPFTSLDPAAHTLAAIALMTVLLWVTEAIPLPAAALLGPALAALAGVAPAKQAFAAFADPLIFLFMGGFMLAAALSRHGFDRRAALWLIARERVAGSPARALVAIVLVSFAFSMWISNTATTAMLIPVALGLHTTMQAALPQCEQAKLARFSGGMCLALAYASSLGGSATPIGTGPNVLAVGMLEMQANARIDFLQWMAFGLPTAAVMTVVVLWLVLRRFPPPVSRIDGLAAQVRVQLAQLGPMRAAERRTLGVFVLAITGWLTPALAKLIYGPEHALAVWARANLEEGAVAIACGCLLFVVPSGRPSDPLLGWDDVRDIDWGTLLLLGGGLSLGRMSFDTGLAQALGESVLQLGASQLGITLAAVALVIVLTEVTSNTATTSMMLPVLIGVAQLNGFDPAPTAVAVTLAASYAFMLPVSTPPNAMVYGTQIIRLRDMVRTGIRLDVVGLLVIAVAAAALIPLTLTN